MTNSQNQALQAPPSKPKSNTRLVAASIVISVVTTITPLLWLHIIAILLAGVAIYRSHRSKGGWIALVLGIMLYVVHTLLGLYTFV